VNIQTNALRLVSHFRQYGSIQLSSECVLITGRPVLRFTVIKPQDQRLNEYYEFIGHGDRLYMTYTDGSDGAIESYNDIFNVLHNGRAKFGYSLKMQGDLLTTIEALAQSVKYDGSGNSEAHIKLEMAQN